MVPSGRRTLAPWFAAWAVVAVVYVWTLTSNRFDLRWGEEQPDYYNLLVDGFLDGQLSLKFPVPPELLQCADPYDPAQRPPDVALHDASLFQGRYYIYYGVVPAATLLLPFRVVAGRDLPIAVAVLLYSLAAYTVMLLLLQRVQRRHFPRVGGIMTLLVAVTVGLASCLPLLIRRASMYELPIASGAFFALASVYALHRASAALARRVRWVAVASLAAGLAVGSRPTYLIGLAAVFGVFAWRGWRERRQADVGSVLPWWLAALLPAAVIGALLAAYNVARFGTPTEFGMTYILSGVYEAKIEHFRLRYLPWNAFAYLVAPLTWSEYFPFLHEARIELVRPAQHFGMDHPFGLLAAVPFGWLALAAAPYVRRHPGTDAALRELVISLCVLASTMAVVLFCFYAAMARYLADFAPAWSLLAAVGAFGLLHRITVRWRRIGRRIAIGGLGLLSCGTVFLFSVQLYGQLRANNPRAYHRLAKILNAPVLWAQGFVGPPDGAVILDVVFPSAPVPDATEELLRTGFGDETDRVLVMYADADHVIFAYEHAGAPRRQSAPVAVASGVSHRVRITMGSLLPPPPWPEKTAGGVAAARYLEIACDEVTVLSQYQRFYDRGEWVVGGAQTRAPFRGPVVKVGREPAAATVARVAPFLAGRASVGPFADATLRLRIRFAPAPAGTREPLIASGETGRADFVVIEHLGENRFRFGFDHWGKRVRWSEPVAFDPARDYVVEIAHPAFGPDARDGVTPARPLRVRVGSERVWETKVQCYEVSWADVYIGSNPLGGSSCGETFAGRIQLLP